MGTRGKYRVEIFRGNNKFWCNGRLVTGPDWRASLITFWAIIVPLAVFYAIALPWLIANWRPVGYIFLAVTAVLAVVMIPSFLLAATSDPGIIPRSREHPPEIAQDPGCPRERKLLVNGVPLRNRYCETCRLWRPPRASHCSVCNNCVERFDHHCPYLGNCVGRRNYRYFFLFVSSTAILTLLAMVIIVFHLVLKTRDFAKDAEEGEFVFLQTLRDGGTAALLVVFIYCLLVFSFTGGLTGFHLYLMSINSTTAEKVKRTWKDTKNPFPERGFWAIRVFLCTKKTHSKMKKGYAGPRTDFDMTSVTVH